MTKQLIILLLCLTIIACSPFQNKTQYRKVPLPVLEEPVNIRVAQVINPRFPSLNHSEIKAALQAASLLIREHFNIRVALHYQKRIGIKDFFAYLPTDIQRLKKQEIINFRDGINTKELAFMVSSIEKSIKKMSKNIDELYQFAKPYLTTKPEGKINYHNLSVALAKTLKTRLSLWQKIQAKDGQGVINADNYNEWVWWDNIGYGFVPYDLIITNQLVASVEKYGMDIHSALRGGISNGTTSYSRSANYGSYSFVSIFPLLNDYPVIQLLRKQKSLSKADKINYLAIIITHELGHQLFHYGHPYGKTECVMSPMPLIDYHQWQKGLDAEKCQKGHYIAMQKGSALLVYEPELLNAQSKPSKQGDCARNPLI